MLEARAALPIAKSKDEMLRQLKKNNVLVICGETGSGKTTQVPQYILDDMIEAGHGGHCNMICTQPRRIAAISVAERVAEERCEPAPGLDGSLIGYQVRLDSARNDQTKLLFCTTGILLRRIAANRSFHGVTHVIVDEVHERSLLMMLYGAMFGCLSPILSISAFLSHKSPFVHSKDERESVERSKLAILIDKTDGSRDPVDYERQSDHIIMMIAYKKWESILKDELKLHKISASHTLLAAQLCT